MITLKRKSMAKGLKATPYFFIGPFVLIYCLFQLIPIVYTFYISFFEWNSFDPSNMKFIGIQNYIDLFSDARFAMSIKNTFILMLMVVPLQIAIGMVLAVFFYSKDTRLKGGFRLLCFLPYLTTPVAVGIIFSILFDSNYGSVNRILEMVGIQSVLWLSEAWPSRFLVAFTVIWQNFGYTAILLLAGLTNINTEVLEAGIVDGTNRFQQFFYIMLPLLRSTMVFVVLTTLIGCFQMFDVPYLLFPRLVGGPDGAVLTGMTLMFDTAFGSVMKFGYGSAISYGLFLIIAVISWIFNKILQGKED